MNSSGKRVDAPSWRTVFGMPVIAGVISTAGLVSALLLGEFGRYFSWIAVGSPILIVLWILARKRRRS